MHRSTARFKVPYCGARFGKSLWAAREIGLEALQPGTHTWIVGPTYDLALKEFNYLWLDYAKSGDLARCKRKSESPEGPPHMTWDDDTWIRVKSTKDFASLLGDELDILLFSEATQIDTAEPWERYCRPRLGSRGGRAAWPTTPKGISWVHPLYLRGQDEDPKWKDWASWNWPTEMNPHHSREDIEQARLEMSPAAFAEQYLAEPRLFSGLIYSLFDPVMNVQEWTFNPKLKTFCSVDFGKNHPAAIWLQEDELENSIIFDEFMEDNVTPEQLADVIDERHKKYKPEAYFCDPAGKQQHGSNLPVMETIRARTGGKVRWVYTTAKEAVDLSNGHDAVGGRICSGEGQRKLFLAQQIADPTRKRGVYVDIGRYQYKKPDSSDNEVKDGIEKNSMDCVRYYVINRFGTLGSQVFRRMTKGQTEEEREDAEAKRAAQYRRTTANAYTGY